MNNCIEYLNNYDVNHDQKKIIIIGDMLDLGESSKKFHKDIVSEIIKTTLDVIIFCGDIYKQIITQ